MGTWIEISSALVCRNLHKCRSLQWERGLKCKAEVIVHCLSRRSLQWERGVKCPPCTSARPWFRRSLQWERGLKYGKPAAAMPYVVSFPAMGTWIEILLLNRESWIASVVPCNGNVDWNYFSFYKWLNLLCRSLQWERGLKYFGGQDDGRAEKGRSLQWERGLKYSHWTEEKGRETVVPCNGNVDWNSSPFLQICSERCRSLQWERGLKFCCGLSFTNSCVVPCNGNVDWNVL